MQQRIQYLLNNIKRPGIDKLQAYLDKSDFYTAPASTKYHDSEEGGLAKHSLKVYENLVLINDIYDLKLSDETVIICGLLHDVAKIRFYKNGTRNVNRGGVWVQEPYYTIDDKFPMAHAAKSVYILNEFIHLSVEEAMAIHWHMGLATTDYTERQTLSRAMEQYPIVLALHTADMQAIYWGGNNNGCRF